MKSQFYDSEKTWPSINHSIPSGVHKIHKLSHLLEPSSLLLSLRNISSILLNFLSGWGAEDRDWNFLWGKFHIPEMEEQCSPQCKITVLLYIAEWQDRLTANAEVATVQGSIPTSTDTVDSEGLQMKQC